MQRLAFQALGNLAESREGRAKLHEPLPVDIMDAAMSSDNREIQKNGQLLPENLADKTQAGPCVARPVACQNLLRCAKVSALGRGWVRWFVFSPPGPSSGT